MHRQFWSFRSQSRFQQRERIENCMQTFAREGMVTAISDDSVAGLIFVDDREICAMQDNFDSAGVHAQADELVPKRSLLDDDSVGVVVGPIEVGIGQLQA